MAKTLYATRSMRALELLAFGPASAPDVALYLKVDQRTARRLLARLEADGYVALVTGEGRRRRYAPTMRIVALAGQVVQHAELTELTAPFVRRLHEETGEVAHLSLPSYRSVLCLVHWGPDGPSSVRPQMRELVPSHCTAAGKALLAYRDSWRESLLEGPLEAHTERTLTDAPALMRDAMHVRARGFALEDGEYQPGVRGIAAPVFNHVGEAVAALGISVPAERLSRVDVPRLGARISAIAAAASAALAPSKSPSLSHPPTRPLNRRRSRPTAHTLQHGLQESSLAHAADHA